ncbi:hypothetical protein A11A3_05881 [Alcanivorax hongdengensis A-11-3]|uniref:Uncharacterized protein n=2 Tax=Alcanivorax hongdengensis TaxID=519051 RepID=L0WE17_9GAMM|nr:hypothetical protein A11A3_05881 [Alcanivorax hongdengensis A-11-3]
MLATLLFLLLDIGTAAWVARFALLSYLLVQWPRQAPMAKGILLVTSGLAATVLLSQAHPLPLLLHGLDRFCFFATFVSSLGLLRVSAMRSRLVREAGQTLIRQKPALRYPTLSLGTALFGLIINIGVLNLFATMVMRSNTLKAAGGHRDIQQARERRMMLSILRGFALAPLVSPLGITMAVILANMPSLTWATLAPVALPTAALFFLLGWWLDWQRRPSQLASRVPATAPPALTPLWRFSLLALAITLSVFAVAQAGQMRLPLAVLVACPLSAIVWMASQRQRLGGGTGLRRAVTQVARHSRLIFGANRGEIAVLGGSACLGALLTPLVDGQALHHLLLASHLHGAAMAIAAMLLVVVLAQLGLNPIVSVTLLASLLGDGNIVDPRLLAVALMCSWSLSMISSPFTASMLVLSQLIQRPARQIAWRWNGLFFVLVVPLLAGWLWMLSVLL